MKTGRVEKQQNGAHKKARKNTANVDLTEEADTEGNDTDTDMKAEASEAAEMEPKSEDHDD